MFVNIDDNFPEYRFIPLNKEPNNPTPCYKDSPTLANGFVAYLINQLQQKDKQQVIEKYINSRLIQYKAKLAAGPNSDLITNEEYDFYSAYEQIENEYLKTSEAIYEYLSDEEVNLIKGFIERFKRCLDNQSARHRTFSVKNSYIFGHNWW
jgi:hypothetical protein